VTGETKVINDDVNYEWLSASITNSKGISSNIISEISPLSGVKGGTIQFVSLEIPPYSAFGGLVYTVTLSATLTNKPVSSNYTVDITILNQGL